MTEEKSWFKKFKDKVTVDLPYALLLLTVTAGLAAIWQYAPSLWIKIVKFFTHALYLPTWFLFLVGFAFIALFVWGFDQKRLLEWERIKEVSIDVLDEIQKKGKYNELLNGEIRVRDGKVYYGDMLRRNTLVPEFEKDEDDSQMRKLAVGMKVRLASGGPPMTILKISGLDQILCCWMDAEKKEHREQYPASVLVKIKELTQKRLTRRSNFKRDGFVYGW
jgi:uncharacterized protein YodC (DUF2158 family)